MLILCEILTKVARGMVERGKRVKQPLNYNRSETISPGGGEIEADFVFTLQVDLFVKKISFLYQ